MKPPVGGPPAARHWQALSDLDVGGRRRFSFPIGFVVLGCVAAVAGTFVLVLKWVGTSSSFGSDVIAGISQVMPEVNSAAGIEPPSAAGSDVEPTSFVSLSSRSGAAVDTAMPHAAPTAVAAAGGLPRTLTAAPPSALASADMNDEAARTAQVIDSLSRWAAAWSRRDVDTYLASYTDDFSGRTEPPSHAAWAQDRRSKILSKHNIIINLSGLSVQTHNKLAVARFTQRYQGDALLLTHRKIVTLHLQQGRWLIQEEAELP